MHKELQNMTLEELWALFPITIVPHQPQWKNWAADIIGKLSEVLSDFRPAIHHIGSTAIPSICAKPVIDILVEISPSADRLHLRAVMEAEGYICMSVSDTRMSFNLGYTPTGYAEKVFHIHFHTAGDNDEVYFRDYLIAHPAVAKDYEALKLSLLPQYRHDRDGYTEAKSEFVKRVTAMARQKLPD